MAQDAGYRGWGTQLTVQEKQKREQAELKAAAAKGECKCERECVRKGARGLAGARACVTPRHRHFIRSKPRADWMPPSRAVPASRSRRL
jgi:hypothetical protein